MFCMCQSNHQTKVCMLKPSYMCLISMNMWCAIWTGSCLSVWTSSSQWSHSVFLTMESLCVFESKQVPHNEVTVSQWLTSFSQWSHSESQCQNGFFTMESLCLSWTRSSKWSHCVLANKFLKMKSLCVTAEQVSHNGFILRLPCRWGSNWVWLATAWS